MRVPYELRPGACDTGVVQRSSIEQDDPATIDAALDFYSHYDDRVARELDAVAADRPSVIVGDIAPLAFDVAARLGVPGVAVANFTWDWIYESHPGMSIRAPRLVPQLRASYARATMAIELPFAGGFDAFSAVQAIPLVARHPTRTREDTRAHFALPPDRRLVLLSFGGYGLPDLDVSAIDAFDTWSVVTTDRIRQPLASLPPHVHLIPEDAFIATGFRYEDLVAAVDVVLTKPGFGITAECVSTGTAMLYTSRGQFREYDVLVQALPRYVRSRFIAPGDLLQGRWRLALNQLLAQPPAPERLATDGAVYAARTIVSVSAAASSG